MFSRIKISLTILVKCPSLLKLIGDKNKNKNTADAPVQFHRHFVTKELLDKLKQ